MNPTYTRLRDYISLLVILHPLMLPQLSCGQSISLKSQLKALAVSEGFQIQGTENLGSEPSIKFEGDPEQLEMLLKDYNYIITRGSNGKIGLLNITSAKQLHTQQPNRAYIKTNRIGNHHQVEALITGPNGINIPLAMLIDTGASTLVLPESMIDQLGFDRTALEAGISQTASDIVHVKVALLQAVTIGNVSVKQVHVSFMPDRALKGTKLLGMSFLSHFRFSLDDEINELVLLGK